jgi:hypothetical protein
LGELVVCQRARLLAILLLLAGCGDYSRSRSIVMAGSLEIDQVRALDKAEFVFSSAGNSWEQTLPFSQVRSGTKDFAKELQVDGGKGAIQLTILIPDYEMTSLLSTVKDGRCDFGEIDLKRHSKKPPRTPEEPPPALTKQRVTPSHEAYSKPDEPSNLERLRSKAETGG